MIREPLLVLAGPTASGKSAIALEVAERMGASILSADSQQVYAGFAVGTAQPTAAERARAPHHLVGHVRPEEDYHVARFVAEAEAVLAAEGAAGRPVIVCGGTGLFIKHLLEGIFEGAPRDAAIRARLEEELARDGLDALRERLRAVDPTRDAQINANDAMRVVRALEVFESTGVAMSEHLRREAAARRPRRAAFVVLDRDRGELDARIDARVGKQVEAGWLEEARVLLALGLPRSTRSFKALGYREMFRVLDGELTMEEARAETTRLVRAYSRRQRTWFRAVRGARWIMARGEDLPVDEVEAALREAAQ